MIARLDRRLVLLLVAAAGFIVGLQVDQRAVPKLDDFLLALGIGFVAGIFVGVVIGITIVAAMVIRRRTPHLGNHEGERDA